MRALRGLAAGAWLGAAAMAAPAGAEIWVQIEAHPTLREAEGRARAYGGRLPNVNGFALEGGWYGLALGPYEDRSQAAAALRTLRGGRLIPADSYLVESESLRGRFWPLGAELAGAAASPPPAPSEETAAEALRSEAALTATERRELQGALQWFGHYSAPIDGDFGPGTRAAMASWQASAGRDATGVLTARERAALLEGWAEGRARLGLAELVEPEAGVALTAPLGLVAREGVQAPFVHYGEADGSGVRLSLISQPGDVAALHGLFQLVQTLDAVPEAGPRSRTRSGFSVRGEAPGRTAQVEARLIDGHIVGFLMSWPPERDALAARALPEMTASLRSVGAPLPVDAGLGEAAQSYDMASGLELRRPLRSGSGFFVDASGTVLTAARNVEGCGRVTLDRLHEARVAAVEEGAAVLRPVAPLAPMEVAALAPKEGRLGSQVSVGGFPYGGALGAATLTFGTLEDVRGLDGSDAVLRLSLEAAEGDAGGPVLDGAGHVAGMLLAPPAGEDRALPGDVGFALKARVLTDVLDRAGLRSRQAEAGTPAAPEDLTERAMGMTVLVSCWE